jgi:hypothetical protein
MYATLRHYEVIDKLRVDEITRKADESLVPSMSELPGFAAFFFIDSGGGVLTSIGLFDDASEAHESTRIAARWVREQKLESAIPNPPKITAGQVVTQEWRGAAVTSGVPA